MAQAGRELRVRHGATAVARALGLRRQQLYGVTESRPRTRASRLRAGDRALARQIRQLMDEEPTYG